MIEAIAAQQTVAIADNTDIATLEENLSPTQHEMIDTKMSKCFEQLIATLEAQMKEDESLDTPEL
jgi:hypothetical protein